MFVWEIRVPTLTVWAFACLNLRKCVWISIVIYCDERLIISLKYTYFCLKVVYCYSYITDIYLFQLRLLQRSMMHDPWFIAAVYYCSKSSKLCARNEPRNLEIKSCWRFLCYVTRMLRQRISKHWILNPIYTTDSDFILTLPIFSVRKNRQGKDKNRQR